MKLESEKIAIFIDVENLTKWIKEDDELLPTCTAGISH